MKYRFFAVNTLFLGIYNIFNHSSLSVEYSLFDINYLLFIIHEAKYILNLHPTSLLQTFDGCQGSLGGIDNFAKRNERRTARAYPCQELFKLRFVAFVLLDIHFRKPLKTIARQCSKIIQNQRAFLRINLHALF